ncbi:Hypothetical_protein [Hexamita inflata]|uniref:Hypothetical_protein n=1 Tax=Hexamita inflata TaxID=28002 RepID=A0AA86P850_9EUKA|nr:Hypothetical protein HINF_LOCUS20261 [Hexamita inflata]
MKKIRFLFQQNKWNNSHVSQSDSFTFTSQMGENRRRKSNYQKANTSARQINRQNKFASLNTEDSSSNSGNFSHYQEQPHRKEQNTHRTDHRKPDKVDYSAISEASEALQTKQPIDSNEENSVIPIFLKLKKMLNHTQQIHQSCYINMETESLSLER